MDVRPPGKLTGSVSAAQYKARNLRTTMDLKETIAAREETYGVFRNVAVTAQELKDSLHDSRNWEALTDTQREAAEMIVSKLARVVCGDPSHKDNWHDIAGYAKLAEDSI